MTSKIMRELNGLSDKELLTRLTELQNNLIMLKGKNFQNNLKETALLPQTKKQIAMIHTILRLRQDRGLHGT